MSSILSSLLIPLVVLMLVVNVYFRIRILGQYNKLKKENIDVNVKALMNKKTRTQYIEENHAKHADELHKLAERTQLLLKIVIAGFLLILFGFIYTYMNR